MLQDIRQSDLFKNVFSFYSDLLLPGQDFVSDGIELTVHPSNNKAAFTGTVFKDLDQSPISKITLVDLANGDLSCPEIAAVNSKSPKWSPDGKYFTYLADTEETPGLFRLVISSDAGQEVLTNVSFDGVIEYFHWSADGQRILVGVAGFGADMAGVHGGATTISQADEMPGWIPEVDTGDAENLWRSLYVYDVHKDTSQQVSPEGYNIWEANWLGTDQIIAVASDSHSEGSWYKSQLISFSAEGGSADVIYQPRDQIGLPIATANGRHIALVEAVCSDRLVVCGTLLLIDPQTKNVTTLDTQTCEVTHMLWRDDQTLVYTGHKGLKTHLAEYNIASKHIHDHWTGDQTIGNLYPAIALLSNGVLGIAEAWDTPPEIVKFMDGTYNVISSLSSGKINCSENIEAVSWTAPDGLSIEGWLVKPLGDGPFPTVMDIHGGPIGACRNKWLGRQRAAKLLVDQGVAIFYPNPRGSSSFGQDFARRVVGDMGGKDTQDFLSGLDALVEAGITDPERIGVAGISYGGFMTCWLITQDDRFVAALPISPVTNWYSQHRTSQIPYFDELFLEDNPFNPQGEYWTRSPVNYVENIKTPVLMLAGAVDQNTPLTQAVEFHRAVLEKGGKSTLLTYANAGHGIRNYPDIIDHTARYVDWFVRHLT